MKYAKETLQRILATLALMIDEFMTVPYEKLCLHISTGNRKIGKTHNFSMAPGHTCPNCAECIWYCYDVKANWQYENVRIARAENTAMMKLDRERTFQQIDEYISKKRLHKAFRWHVSGDILDTDYFDHMCIIARNHPDWIFWTYTKNYWAVNEWIDIHSGKGSNWRESVPFNLVPMFSIWNGMECPNPHNLPTFTCIMEGMTPAPDEWRCPGNCQACLESGHGCPFGESSNVDAH